MIETAIQYPQWPPGLWRRIILYPGKDWIGGALEDDLHRFHLRFDHDGERIVTAHAAALRHPWTACPGAAPHIASELTGALLADVAARDPVQHCTHLFDLAVVLAAHAQDSVPLCFDMRVADRVDGLTTATMEQDGAEVLRWHLDGTAIGPGGDHAGLDLRRLSQWKQDLPPHEAERATMLRRAVFVSGGRQFTAPPGLTAVQQGAARQGVCFNYQAPQSSHSTRTPNWITDFSAGNSEPLGGFDSEQAFASMASS